MDYPVDNNVENSARLKVSCVRLLGYGECSSRLHKLERPLFAVFHVEHPGVGAGRCRAVLPISRKWPISGRQYGAFSSTDLGLIVFAGCGQGLCSPVSQESMCSRLSRFVCQDFGCG